MDSPALSAFVEARARLQDAIRHTPSWRWDDPRVAAWLPGGAEPWFKLELFQHTGSFKARAALLHARSLGPGERERGLVAVSAGNHGLAVAWAARALGTTAKIVMPRSADPIRVQGCAALGAVVVLADDVHAAFAESRRIEHDEGRSFVHPFEGPTVALATGGIALELLHDVPALDAVVVPIGGGGLAAGIAAVVKAQRPDCAVYGVEPEGADSMTRSLAAGAPRGIDRVRTIADSLGAPHAEPYSFGLCQRFLDDVVRVDDEALCRALALLFTSAKLAVEPAGAAAVAGMIGPLRERLAGRRVGLVVCGANIGATVFADLLGRGSAGIRREGG